MQNLIQDRILNKLKDLNVLVKILPRITDIKDAIKLAERILDSNKSPIEIKDEMVSPKTSIGISIYPQDGDTIEILISNADKAMFLAKKSGKNQYSIFNSK